MTCCSTTSMVQFAVSDSLGTGSPPRTLDGQSYQGAPLEKRRSRTEGCLSARLRAGQGCSSSQRRILSMRMPRTNSKDPRQQEHAVRTTSEGQATSGNSPDGEGSTTCARSSSRSSLLHLSLRAERRRKCRHCCYCIGQHISPKKKAQFLIATRRDSASLFDRNPLDRTVTDKCNGQRWCAQ